MLLHACFALTGHQVTEKKDYRNNALQRVLDKLKIVRWDFVLIGDGSGTTRERACGWASVLIDRHNRRQWYGGRMNFGGSNIVAETMAYVHPLLDICRQHRRKAGGASQALRLHIITDCQHVADAGNNPALRRGQPVLWAPFVTAEHLGVFTRWHWWGRDEIRLNKFSHEMANAQRKALDDENEVQTALNTVLKPKKQRNLALQNCTKFRPE